MCKNLVAVEDDDNGKEAEGGVSKVGLEPSLEGKLVSAYSLLPHRLLELDC